MQSGSQSHTTTGTRTTGVRHACHTHARARTCACAYYLNYGRRGLATSVGWTILDRRKSWGTRGRGCPPAVFPLGPDSCHRAAGSLGCSAGRDAAPGRPGVALGRRLTFLATVRGRLARRRRRKNRLGSSKAARRQGSSVVSQRRCNIPRMPRLRDEARRGQTGRVSDRRWTMACTASGMKACPGKSGSARYRLGIVARRSIPTGLFGRPGVWLGLEECG